MTDFEKMGIMSKEGKDIRMTSNVLAADKVKKGGKITFGVDADTFNVIINQMATGERTHYVAMYVINKEEFESIK